VIAKSIFLAVAALALSALTGCGPHFDHLDFEEKTTPPLPVSLLSTGVTVPVGVAVAFAPIAMDGTERMEDAKVDLVSSDASVLGVDRAVDESAGYVIYGVRAGHAQISIFVDGSAEGSLPATVTAQSQ
jgi:hypothetical protein